MGEEKWLHCISRNQKSPDVDMEFVRWTESAGVGVLDVVDQDQSLLDLHHIPQDIPPRCQSLLWEWGSRTLTLSGGNTFSYRMSERHV